jgi:hypothetical protein
MILGVQLGSGIDVILPQDLSHNLIIRSMKAVA